MCTSGDAAAPHIPADLPAAVRTVLDAMTATAVGDRPAAGSVAAELRTIGGDLAAEIHAVEQLLVTPAQRLVVALAAVHAARPDTIRRLTLDDLDLPNRRITLAGHQQPIADLVHQALRAWLEQRRDTWPRTPNRHVLISAKSWAGHPSAAPTSPSACCPAVSSSTASAATACSRKRSPSAPTRCTWPWSSTSRTPPPRDTPPSPRSCSTPLPSPTPSPGRRPRAILTPGTHAQFRRGPRKGVCSR